jgi:taurine dioxygenase
VYGGDAQFVNVAAVYQGLSASVRALIDELHAEHRFGATVSAERSAEKIGDLVRTNPLASLSVGALPTLKTDERS